jgi:hypothetical protein
MKTNTKRLEELQAWGVDLDLIRHNLTWSPAHRLEIMEGIIQIGLQTRQHTLDPQQHADLLRLHFASPLPLLAALAPVRTIIIGRLAGILQGVPGVAYTLDLYYAHDEATLHGIAQAFAPFIPTPPIMAADLRREQPLVVDTSQMVVRLFPAIAGIGSYQDALPTTTLLDVGGIVLRVLTLTALLAHLKATPEPDDTYFVPLVETTDLLQHVA